MDRIQRLIPQSEWTEQAYLEGVTEHLTDHQLRNFTQQYLSQRANTNTTLILAAVGIICVAGLHRFYVKQNWMAVLYLLTGGIFFIGTIRDIILHKKLTVRRNKIIATEVLNRLNY